MKKLAHLTIAAALALTACGGDSGDDEAKPPAAATAPPAETTTTTVVWTEAMQNACTSEAEALDLTLDAYYGAHRPKADTASLIRMEHIKAPPTYWDVKAGELVGKGDNEDERCGGIYLP